MIDVGKVTWNKRVKTSWMRTLVLVISLDTTKPEKRRKVLIKMHSFNDCYFGEMEKFSYQYINKNLTYFDVF